MNISDDDKISAASDLSCLKSYRILETSRKVNIFSTIIIACIGFIGHSLIVFVFSQKRFRTNSCNIILLSLAINDSLFLLAHLFEDTLRTYQDIYINEDNSHTALNLVLVTINLTDKYNLVCRLVNYMRYVLRFISSYTLVAFTLQRLSIIYKPLTSIFRLKKTAWITISTTALTSLILNLWALFLFELQPDEKTQYCDIKKEWATEYVLITAVYIGITLFIPIIIIFSSNLLIILSLHRSESKLKEYNKQQHVSNSKYSTHGKQISSMNHNRAYDSTRLNKRFIHTFHLEMKPQHSFDFRIKPFYSNINKIANRANNSKNSTKILLTISFVFILFNLPYLISWIIFYYKVAFKEIDLEVKDYLFAVLQISEIFYVFNYASLFYVYCLSGSRFRNQLKHSSKDNSFFSIFFIINKILKIF